MGDDESKLPHPAEQTGKAAESRERADLPQEESERKRAPSEAEGVEPGTVKAMLSPRDFLKSIRATQDGGSLEGTEMTETDQGTDGADGASED